MVIASRASSRILWPRGKLEEGTEGVFVGAVLIQQRKRDIKKKCFKLGQDLNLESFDLERHARGQTGVI